MRNEKSCHGCIWEDDCAEEYACEYYDSGEQQSSEEAKNIKKDFTKQWYEYMTREG